MMTPSPSRLFGIMTTQSEGFPPFLSRDFYRKLCLIGSRAGMTVFVFTPQGIRWSEGTVRGYSFDAAARRWVSQDYAMPDVVYDRCFFVNRNQHEAYREVMRTLRTLPSPLLLGYGLKGKWEVQQMLEQDGRFGSHLPRTEVMRSVQSAAEWLKARSEVLLKPQAGSQGCGVVLVRRAAGRRAQARKHAAAVEITANAGAAFTVIGRDARNGRVARSFADTASLLRWLRRFTAQRSYLLQQYLPLHGRSGEAYDVRSLVQKDGTGQWQVTGMAVRKGQIGSLTSNLHGGGTVEPVKAYLTAQFGNARSDQILSEMKKLSKQIPEALEQSHGRLAELGIDFGVDTSGHIWLLEVNSKPGRAIFSYLHDKKARFNALANPIRYARYLMRHHRNRESGGETKLSVKSAPLPGESPDPDSPNADPT
ncbi:YheC/YheD family protein [Paenibacillus sp. OAS669]|uniref:YheC/YheD family endospore coat-associated protein n=1 Tax=Paenibacillus sp. OAS669 TaxID=2663821 RepID=UPI0017895039|nr:YheC/YheD family protein [Paenibacillus sp. OAS669]MBE1441365.1 glutathione synthase/RimK-type ligase-like ATP-grasp enzyme [Paenibacillus sp. OAS669]